MTNLAEIRQRDNDAIARMLIPEPKSWGELQYNNALRAEMDRRWLLNKIDELTANTPPDAAQALRDAAAALNIEGLNYKPNGWGSNPADQQTADALGWVMTWLNARADSLAAGTE